jgi:chromosome segregation ATPase
MAEDQRMIQRLQEELTAARARAGEYSAQVVGLTREREWADAKMREHEGIVAERDRAIAKQVAAEKNAAAAERKQKQAEHELRGVRGQLEAVEAERDRAQAEADELNALNAKVESAMSIRDLVS